ncbi:MAG: PDZ domain-containing protein [Chitinophagaceae bacterium]|nr:PDZ domain-containing protein [Chitinophagaceae bacterium]
MNTITKPAALLVVLGLVGGSAMAQLNIDKIDSSNNNKTIVIRPNTNSKEKITVVVEGDKITVNGKPVDEFKSEAIDITRGLPASPEQGFFGLGTPDASTFRGGWNMTRDGAGNMANKALLGVRTDKSDKGALVEEVTEGSAAEKAGLKNGDVITQLDDNVITDAASLFKAVSKYNAEDKVTISYLREGKEAKTTAVLTKNNAPSASNVNPFPGDFEGRNFNFRMLPEDVDREFRRLDRDVNRGRKPKLGIQIQDTEDNSGVTVLDVSNSSAAGKAGLLKGDLISSVNGKKVTSSNELKDLIADAKEGDSIKVTYSRNSKKMETTIKIPKKLQVADL